jgi:hypothetical protein
MSEVGQSRRMDTPDDLAACPLYLQQLPCPASRRANDESGAEPRRLRLAQRIPATGRGAERCLIRRRAAVQAEREPSSEAARNIRLAALTLEDRGHA